MAADPIIYCLQELTDYEQFERLCHDLVSLDGYKHIEPLGGSKDKGRDAIHTDRNNDGKATVFAYSVREDWRKKLSDDAEKVSKHGHSCDRFVFLCTARFSPNERDEAITYLRNKYSWECELYGLERLRVLLATTHKDVVAHHPQIFCSPFFSVGGGLSLAPCHDQIVIDNLDSDTPLALWIARRLTLSGYHVWCRQFAPLAGNSISDTVKSLIRTRAFRYLPVLSPAAVNCPDLAARRNAAHAAGEERKVALVLPIYADEIDVHRLEHDTQRLEAAHFETSWAEGLRQLLAALEAAQCPKHADGASSIVLQSFMPPNVLVDQQEIITANVFPVKTVPKVLMRFFSNEPVNDQQLIEARKCWAFRKVSPTHFISFCPPPVALQQQHSLEPKGASLWSAINEMDSISVYDLVKELLRRSMDVACTSKGLSYCPDRNLFYFPHELLPHNMLSVIGLEGQRKRVGIAGERTFGTGVRKAKYRYYLAPTFSVSWRSNRYEVLVRPRLRISDTQGCLLLPRAALARRKDIGGTWWNDDWMYRVMGVMQFLADGELIKVGSSADNTVEVEALPQTWRVETGINENALQDAKSSRDEVAKRMDDDDGELTDETNAE